MASLPSLTRQLRAQLWSPKVPQLHLNLRKALTPSRFARGHWRTPTVRQRVLATTRNTPDQPLRGDRAPAPRWHAQILTHPHMCTPTSPECTSRHTWTSVPPERWTGRRTQHEAEQNPELTFWLQVQNEDLPTGKIPLCSPQRLGLVSFHSQVPSGSGSAQYNRVLGRRNYSPPTAFPLCYLNCNWFIFPTL